MTNNTTPKNERLISLDAFRGLTIMGMIMVNNPGTWSAVYPPLRHAAWHGWTPTDLVFPFFLFMVGVSIVFSLQKRLVSGESKLNLSLKVVWRAVKIFLLAMLLTLFYKKGWPDSIDTVRFCGVLQRIALVFLICGLIFIFTKPRTQAVLCVLFLVGYFLCMTKIPMPGAEGKVSLEPGNNIAAYVDSKIMPFGRFYQGPHRDNWDEKLISWDPEGPFSTIPALATCLTGVFAGLLLRDRRRTQERKVIILYFAGFLLLVGGYLWGLCFPINKPLWTSSYVLLTSGFAGLILASCVYFIDMLGHRKIMYPAVVFGSNAITMFVLSGVLASLIFYGGDWKLNTKTMEFIISCGGSKEFASMCYALLFVAVNFIPAWLLYHFRIYVRL